MTATTQLQPGAWPGRPYASFAGRAAVHVAVTQLQCGAWGGMRYGSFSGRAPYVPPVGTSTQVLRNRQGYASAWGFV